MTGIICGLQWNNSRTSLAVGCNNNKVQIFDSHSSSPSETMLYQSAVKAIAWHPSQHRVIATGAGQNDQRIVVWDLNNAAYKNCIDTKSQITGIMWSPYSNHTILTSHGHFDPNLRVWDLKNNVNTHKLVGHSSMIVSLAHSPYSNQVLSLAGDDTLRLWNVFSKKGSGCTKQNKISLLSLDKVR